MNPLYLSFAIRMGKDQLINRVTGSIVRHISAKSLKTVLIKVPTINLQNKFSEFYKHLDKSKIALKDVIKSLNKIYTSIVNTNLG